MMGDKKIDLLIMNNTNRNMSEKELERNFEHLKGIIKGFFSRMLKLTHPDSFPLDSHINKGILFYLGYLVKPGCYLIQDFHTNFLLIRVNFNTFGGVKFEPTLTMTSKR